MAPDRLSGRATRPSPVRILIVTDAWYPQVNGVVRTVSRLAEELRAAGRTVAVVGPHLFRTVPCPTYPEIRLSVLPGRRLARMIEDFRPDALHLVTEGPLGLAARRWAIRNHRCFTTSFHTRFPEYIQARTGFPTGLPYRFLRWFHGAAALTLVPTPSLLRALGDRGFRHLECWTRGVDAHRFRPGQAGCDWHTRFGVKGPYLLYVGRVAVEKNLTAFLDLDVPGTKIVVGDGPDRTGLAARYPDAVFTGYLDGADLSAAYAASDVFVFPSLTDTFGLVILEALSCGLPVAAFDVTGPRDILPPGVSPVGAIGPDLRRNVLAALHGDRAMCRAYVARFGWDACARMFLDAIARAQHDAMMRARPDAIRPAQRGGWQAPSPACLLSDGGTATDSAR
ncbi:glycosyltransferase family 4 protein [Gluconacetobacter tumulisoli]|uniref:Glycosyltransferase family 1 protein n=1 Tax=Gluconacetobacter tumulisoli TaxID=1286189 RepID=A0A7W4K776_9PROT|nr:glycosyltransferase family 1 protein [Gluconacetobacter tumulisoli]MBB2201542.1 glycosyltransferase family 1 protein [Gluconacetobacter tumulisoli]